jgi:hypothetical protein
LLLTPESVRRVQFIFTPPPPISFLHSSVEHATLLIRQKQTEQVIIFYPLKQVYGLPVEVGIIAPASNLVPHPMFPVQFIFPPRSWAV